MCTSTCSLLDQHSNRFPVGLSVYLQFSVLLLGNGPHYQWLEQMMHDDAVTNEALTAIVCLANPADSDRTEIQ